MGIWLSSFLGGDISKNEIRVSMFREYIEWMQEERGLSPVIVNVRIRTMRAFVRFNRTKELLEELTQGSVS